MVKTLRIPRSTRWLLVLLATVGMLVPTEALPCCGCCRVEVSRADSPPAQRSCCAKQTSSCCSANQSSSDLCCVGTSDCNKPDCRCKVVPWSAVLLAAREPGNQDTFPKKLALASLPTQTEIALPANAYSLDRANAPPPDGTARLHALLSVWLN